MNDITRWRWNESSTCQLFFYYKSKENIYIDSFAKGIIKTKLVSF